MGVFLVILVIGISIICEKMILSNSRKKYYPNRKDDSAESGTQNGYFEDFEDYKYENVDYYIKPQKNRSTDNTERAVNNVVQYVKTVDSEGKKIAEEFDLKRAIIYKEILEPKYKEY